jgi:CubicO group peptidase (beta-lactamase class C family)
MKMASIAARVQGLGPAITDLMSISGCTGVSIGISHRNEIVHTAGFGYRDVEKGLIPDADTIYHLASLSKSFTAAALGILAHDKKLDLNQPLKEILSTFSQRDPKVSAEATTLDFLAHRTGLASKQGIWAEDGQDLLIDFQDVLPLVSYLEPLHPFRSSFLYNNYGYDVGAAVIEKTSGVSYGSFVTERILQPLKMNRTTATMDIPPENYAEGYFAGLNGEQTPIGRPHIASGTVMAGANGIKSCVNDLLKYYGATIRGWKNEIGTADPDAPQTPLKNVLELVTGHIPIDKDSEFEQSYGAGWAIAELPAPVGAIGINGMFVSKMPIAGKGSPKKKIWYNNGSLVGFFSSVYIVPEDEIIIVVLTNSFAKNDCADWIGQLLLEAAIDNPDKNDYIVLAKESAAKYAEMWAAMPGELAKTKTSNESSRPLTDYVGNYYNSIHNFFIQIGLTERNGTEQLFLSFQGFPTQTHFLKPHAPDEFSWLLSEEENRHIARWPDLDVSIFVLHFAKGDDGEISRLRWVHDWDVPEGEWFSTVPDSKIPGGVQQPLALED